MYLEGHVGDVNELIVCDGEQVKETQLRKCSWLDLLYTVTVDEQLLQ